MNAEGRPEKGRPTETPLDVEAKPTGFLRLERAAFPWRLPPDDRGALLSLLALCDSRDGGLFEGSARSLAPLLGGTKDAAHRRLKSLEAVGELKVEELGRGQEHPSIYRVVRYHELTGYADRFDGPLARRLTVAELRRSAEPTVAESDQKRRESETQPSHIRDASTSLPAETGALDVDRRERRRARAREGAARTEDEGHRETVAAMSDRARERIERDPWANLSER